jgi:hypothetical protein
MGNFLGFPCCRRSIESEKIVDLLIETYGVKNLQANIEQLKDVGINVKCPFCRTVCWVEPPSSNLIQMINTCVPNTH